jgi:hypothetical protein
MRRPILVKNWQDKKTMGQKIFTLLLVFGFAATTVFVNAASYTTSKSKVVSVNPISLTWGQLNLQYEQKISAKNSFTVDAGFWSPGGDWTAINIGAAYRWYFDLFEEGKGALNGLSVAPRVALSLWSNSHAHVDGFTGLSLGADVAYKWVFGEGKWAVEPVLRYGFGVMTGAYTPQAYGFGVNLGMTF